jgi:peptide deformylase
MLRKPAAVIDTKQIGEPTLQTLITDMTETMHASNGIGIAAPQVNASLRVCMINKEAFPKRFELLGTAIREDIALINPYWERISRKHDTDIEGCLSIPQMQGRVKRWKDIVVTAYTKKGDKVQFEAHGYLARVIQHEVDHLEGILYLDRTDDVWEVE